MSDKKFINVIYDILAQNNNYLINNEKDLITDLIDHVDSNKKCIVFRLPRGEEYTLTLTSGKGEY